MNVGSAVGVWIGRIGDGVVPDSSQTSEVGGPGRTGTYAMPGYALEER